MIQAILFTKEGDPQLDQIKRDLSKIQGDFPHQLHVVDIDRDPILLGEFEKKAPVLDIGVFRLIKEIDLTEIRSAFSKADARLQEARKKHNDVLVRQMTEPMRMSKSDRFSRWFSRHYMVLLNLFTFLYVFLAVLAPTFMHIGWEAPGKTIYKVYSPLCHQLAFRSFFLYGDQIYYPRELAGLDEILSYGEATGFNEFNITTAREFLGNEVLGYKMALCERDIAIYGAILLFGVIFTVTGRRIKPLPWYLWIIIGLGPIGLDGFSQLLSQSGLAIFNWLPLRESTPLLRTLTGGLFGLATAWFGYPYLEESVLENRHEMQLKHAIVDQIESSRQ